jgi:hypothetical protein
MTTILKARGALRRRLVGVSLAGGRNYTEQADSNDMRDEKKRAEVGSRLLLERLTAEHGEAGRPDTFIVVDDVCVSTDKGKR